LHNMTSCNSKLSWENAVDPVHLPESLMPIVFMDAQELQEWQGALSEFDKQFTYPLDAEHKFHVSQGAHYNAYFDRIGESRHALIHTREGKVIAIISFIRKQIELAGRPYYALYVADLKIDRAYRGKGLAQKFYAYLLSNPRSLWFYVGCPLLFFVGMEGAKGTIMRGFKGFWSQIFLKPLGSMKIYMISPQELLKKFPEKITEKIDFICNLSSAHNAHSMNQYFDCSGVLDFYFDKNPASSKVAHLNTGTVQGEEFLAKLHTVTQIIKNDFDFISFALDERRQDLISAFEEKGIVTKTRAVLGGVSFIPRLRRGIISLNTDEI
jgi:hypothetical protein